MTIQFVKTKATSSPKQYILGTTVDIETILSDELSSADTITVQIEDSWDRIKIQDAAMTEVTPSVYNYLWQSTAGGVTDEAGIYTAFITVTTNGQIYIDSTEFEMINILED